MNRHALSIVVVMLCGGCGHVDKTPVPVVNLIREVDHADKRPANGFEIATRTIDGQIRPSIVVPVPSRLTIPLPIPRHGVLRTFASIDPTSAAAPVRLRVGVSDDRIYELLADVDLSPGDRHWISVRADLSAYAGWKWSFFYHPERIVWHIVLGADALGGTPTRAIWGSPEIVTDHEAAKEYAARRQRLR